MATTCDSAATDDRSLIQTQQVPKDLTASIQTMQARIPTRSPSVESFDWFNEYIDYSESINSSPTTSGNALMEMLLRFQKRFDNYENERAYESFTEGLRLEYPCNDCRILNTFPALQKCLQDAEEKMTPMAIENWAQATVAKAVQSNGRDNFFMRLGGLVGDLYIDLGRVWDARIFLEQTILEIKRIDGPVYYRKSATLSLVRCYFESGNIQKADELLKTLFKRELPEIVASSYLFLEDYCREHQVRLLKRCYSKAKDDFVQDLNDTEEYDWEEDDDELRIRVMAARVTRTMNPGIFEEIGGCDNGFDCSVSADNDLDDKFDDDLVDDPDDELDNDMQSDEQ
jgi:tetratricopeptide (TPR) repeat protein